VTLALAVLQPRDLREPFACGGFGPWSVTQGEPPHSPTADLLCCCCCPLTLIAVLYRLTCRNASSYRWIVRGVLALSAAAVGGRAYLCVPGARLRRLSALRAVGVARGKPPHTQPRGMPSGRPAAASHAAGEVFKSFLAHEPSQRGRWAGGRACACRALACAGSRRSAPSALPVASRLYTRSAMETAA
jgi:hypothetical protein